MAEWANWDRTISSKPSDLAFPETEEEVRKLVQGGARPIRAVGAGHSWSHLVDTSGVIVSLDRLRIEPNVDRATRQATVSAGIRLRDLGPLLRTHNLCMRNVGAVTAQSLAGAMSTGTHGSGIGYGILGTQISALRVVDGYGDVREFNEREHPQEMAALRLNLGCLGIITSVTIGCVRDHNVKLDQYPMSFGDFLDAYDDLYKKNERVRAYWFPGSKLVYVNTMNRTEEPDAEGPVYSWFEAVLMRNWVLSLFWTKGRFIPPLIPTLNKVQEVLGYHRSSVVGPCFEAITTPMPPRHQEAESTVPAEAGRKALEDYDKLVREHHIHLNVPAELRFVAGDDVMLSPCNRGPVFYIGWYTATYVKNDPHFKRFGALMEKHGGRPHWGKIGAPNRAKAQSMYPRFEEFADFRAQMDPKGLFANGYIRNLFGL